MYENRPKNHLVKIPVVILFSSEWIYNYMTAVFHAKLNNLMVEPTKEVNLRFHLNCTDHKQVSLS